MKSPKKRPFAAWILCMLAASPALLLLGGVTALTQPGCAALGDIIGDALDPNSDSNDGGGGGDPNNDDPNDDPNSDDPNDDDPNDPNSDPNNLVLANVSDVICPRFVELEVQDGNETAVFQAASSSAFNTWRNGDEVEVNAEEEELENLDRDDRVTAVAIGQLIGSSALLSRTAGNSVVTLTSGDAFQIAQANTVVVAQWNTSDTIAVVQSGSNEFVLINTSRCTSALAEEF